MDTTYLFAEIVKSVKQDDGTLLVTGPVSTSALDRDQQIANAAWLDRAVPQWFSESGNVREMHSAKAAGVGVSYWKGDGGSHWIEALVVDPVSVSKVEHKVLKGFSIGIKNPRVVKSQSAANGEIVDGSIIEVSLVDRPANPECLLTLSKADDSGVLVDVEQSLVENHDRHQPVEPEPEQTTQVTTLESEHPLAPVQSASSEVRQQAQTILAGLTSMGFAETGLRVKADAATKESDSAAAERLLGEVARLIMSEAKGLAAGDLGERYDISILLCVYDALRDYCYSERSEEAIKTETVDTPAAPETVEPVEAEAPAQPEVPEPADADPVIPSPSTPVDELTPDGGRETITLSEHGDVLTKAETIELVKAEVAAALAKADETHKAETESLRADVAKAEEAAEASKAELAAFMERPVPGGPVRVRLPQHTTLADDRDRHDLTVLAEEYDRKAEMASDRTLREGYKAKAIEAREKATR